MAVKKSDIVLSLAGHDRGNYFLVIEAEDNFALIADGKGRRIEKPKRKKLKHLRFIAEASGPVPEKIRSGGTAANSELRRALAEFAASHGEEGGM